MATWSLAGFDWVRFRALAPDLRRAESVRELQTSANAQVAEVAGAFADTVPIAQVCNAVIVEICTVGRWVTIRPSLPGLIRELRQRDSGEDAADIITDLALSAHNIEPWFKAEAGLMGLATRADVQHLASHLAAYDRDTPKARHETPRIVGWARRLKPSGDTGDIVADVADVVAGALREELGLAAILEE